MNIILLFLFVHLSILSIGIALAVKRKQFIARSKVIEGTIRNVSIRRNLFYPVVQYYEERTDSMSWYKSKIGIPRKVKIGKKIKLRYYYDERRKIVMFNNWFHLWYIPMTLIVFGAIGFIILLLMLSV